MEENTISKVADYLIETYPDEITLSKNKNSLLYNKVICKSLTKYYNKKDILKKLGVFETIADPDFDLKNFDKSLIEQVVVLIKENQERELSEKVKKYSGKGSKIDPDMFELYIDAQEHRYKNNENIVIAHKVTGAILNGTISVAAVRSLMGINSFNALLPTLPLVYKKFNPYLVNETLKDRVWTEYNETLEMEVVHLNTCIQPKWRYKRDKSVTLSPDEIHFIKSCFETEESFYHYINCAYFSVVGKLWFYVLLMGAKATGKTTLVEMLIPLVGSHNYRKAPQNALKKEFNGYKLNKRLIFMDETVANNSEAINILKSDANKEYNVELKNKDAMTVKNFANVWMASNNISDYKFTYDERRFAVLDISKKTTEERGISKEWMSDFSRKIEGDDPKWADRFFNWLEENHDPSYNTYNPYKGETFDTIVYESLTNWQKSIHEAIIENNCGHTIELSDCIDFTDRYSPEHHKKIIDFIENYRPRGQKLGEYVRSSSIKTSSIKVNPYYSKEIVSDLRK